MLQLKSQFSPIRRCHKYSGRRNLQPPLLVVFFALLTLLFIFFCSCSGIFDRPETSGPQTRGIFVNKKANIEYIMFGKLRDHIPSGCKDPHSKLTRNNASCPLLVYISPYHQMSIARPLVDTNWDGTVYYVHLHVYTNQ